MKRLLAYLLLVLSFGFIFNTKADDISDFEIEGMSVGESLLKYFDEETILKNPKYDHTNTNWNDDKMFQVRTFENGPYTEIMFALKKNDKKYIIYGLSGLVKMEYNISKCYSDIKSIVADMEHLFPNAIKSKLIKSKLKADKSGKSKHRAIYFDFDSGDYVRVECYDWSKKMGYWDNLRIGIITKEFDDWLNNSAY